VLAEVGSVALRYEFSLDKPPLFKRGDHDEGDVPLHGSFDSCSIEFSFVGLGCHVYVRQSCGKRNFDCAW
jgi:hypothetical protein